MASRKTILAGEVFNRWTVLKELKPQEFDSGAKLRLFLCECECGNKSKVIISNLTTGKSKSCGCIQDEQRVVQSSNSGRYHPLYPTYTRGMMQRCYNPNRRAFMRYGGRGIYVCDDWFLPDGEGFWSFVRWAEANGWYKGCGLSIDRIDNDGPYAPWNCRWATSEQQNNNTSFNRRLKYKGETLTASQLCRKYGIEGLKPNTFTGRLDLGWSIQKALVTAIDTRKSRRKS